MTTKTYSELITIPTFQERFKYAKVNGRVGEDTFGCYRYLNQRFYDSYRWKKIRRQVILRDDGCDLAFKDRPIGGFIYIHHIEPITVEDILKQTSKVFDLDNLVCVSSRTHNAIHYGNEDMLFPEFAERTEGDTCPWRIS